MNLQHHIRKWLGIDSIIANQQNIWREQAHLHRKIDNLRTQISTITPGLGRVIAKLDPQVARDEQSPAMRAESDALAEQVIRRFNAEQAVRDQYGYTPKDTE